MFYAVHGRIPPLTNTYHEHVEHGYGYCAPTEVPQRSSYRPMLFGNSGKEPDHGMRVFLRPDLKITSHNKDNGKGIKDKSTANQRVMRLSVRGFHPLSFIPHPFKLLFHARSRDTITVLYFTAFRLRPCRPSKCRSVCHAYGQSCARPLRHAAARGRLPRRILCWFVVLVFVSLGSFQQLCDSSGVIIHAPGVGQKTIVLIKIFPAARKSPKHIGSGDVMPALPYPRGDASQPQPWRRYAEIDHLDPIAAPFPTLEPI